MSPRAYLTIALALTLFITAGIAAVNSVVDPYGLRSLDPAAADAAAAPDEDAGEFWRKAFAVRAIKPRTILLGTSRAGTGLDARHPAFGAADLPVLNLALGASDIDQMRLLLVHAHTSSRITKAVIGLDLESFVTSGRPDFDAAALTGNPQSDPSWVARFRIALSREVLWAAVTRAFRSATANAAQSGELSSAETEALIQRLDGQRGLIWVAEFNNFYSRLPHLFPYWPPGTAWGSDARRAASMQAFRELLAYAREQGIELRMFISPVHARYLEWYRRVGWWPLFEGWKRELVAAIDEESRAPAPRRAAVTLWDFSGFHAVATEPVPRIGDLTTRMHWYLESSHYSPQLGNLVLERILAEKAAESALPDARIDAANIEHHLSMTLSGADRYRVSHRGEIANVGQMVGYLRRIARK